MQRPILQLGASFGDSNDILNELDYCSALDVSDKNAMKEKIKSLFRNWQSKQDIAAASDKLEKYTHSFLVNKLVEEIGRLA